MKFSQFRRQSAAPTGHVFVFACQDDFLVEESKAVWTQLFGGNWVVEKISAKELDAIEQSELMSLALTPPLFGDSRVLMVTNAGKVPKKRLTHLVEINALRDSSLKIILCVAGRRSLQAWVKTFKVVEIDPLRPADTIRWIKERYGVRSEVASYIVENIGAELYPLYGELEKLQTYVKKERPIEMEDVDMLILRSEQFGPFELDDAVLARDYRKAVRVTEAMIEEGVEPLKILGKLASLWRKLFASKQLIDRGLGSEVSRALGLHDFVAGKLRKAAGGFSSEQMVLGFSELLKADKAFKSTSAGANPEYSFDAMLWKMIGRSR